MGREHLKDKNLFDIIINVPEFTNTARFRIFVDSKRIHNIVSEANRRDKKIVQEVGMFLPQILLIRE